MRSVLFFLLLLVLFTGSLSYIAVTSANSDNGRVMKTLYINEGQNDDKEVRVFGKGTNLEH